MNVRKVSGLVYVAQTGYVQADPGAGVVLVISTLARVRRGFLFRVPFEREQTAMPRNASRPCI